MNSVSASPEPAPDPPFDVELPAGFTQVDDLAEIAAYVAAQLHAGLGKREILRRLHGWVPGGEAV